MQYVGNPLDMDVTDTDIPAPCATYFPECNTCAPWVKPPTNPYAPSMWTSSGTMSPAQLSRKSYTPSNLAWESLWDYIPIKYLTGPSNHEASWRYCSETSMQKTCVSLGVGATTKCCAKSKSWHGPSYRGMSRLWLTLGITPSHQRRPFNPQMLEHLQGNGGLLGRHTTGRFGLGVSTDIHLTLTSKFTCHSI